MLRPNLFCSTHYVYLPIFVYDISTFIESNREEEVENKPDLLSSTVLMCDIQLLSLSFSAQFQVSVYFSVFFIPIDICGTINARTDCGKCANQSSL